MKPNEYQAAADKVNSGYFYADSLRVNDYIEALHRLIGLAQDMDAIKKVLFRGRSPSDVGLIAPIATEMPLSKVVSPEHADLMHGFTGVVTEVGELAEAVLALIINGKPIDIPNLREETGDILWYVNRLLRAGNTTFEAEFDRNIAKLTGRHGDSFNDEKDVDRDLDNERAILENEFVPSRLTSPEVEAVAARVLSSGSYTHDEVMTLAGSIVSTAD